MENLLLWGLYVMSFYAFLPGIVSRTFGFRVFKKGRAEKTVSLTFDDGPDEQYTPILLDLLKRYQAKATFFVVGVHAEKHPELLKRMHDEGHIIGIHNYVHKSNWLMRPKTVRKSIERTAAIIEEATGVKPTYYRPPWGIINLFDYGNLGYLQIILWSAMFGDWRIKLGTERLKQRLMRKLSGGQVLLLHDCGKTWGADPDAPANTIAALEAYLEEGTKRGFSFVSINRMIEKTDQVLANRKPLWKRAIIALWLKWEAVFHVMFRLKKVGSDEHPAFHYRLRPYQGREIELRNGEILTQGDPIVELHFDNQTLSSYAEKSNSPVGIGVRLLRDVDKALPVLADQLEQDSEAKGIKAVYGVTMIHRGADRLGFEVHSMGSGWFARTSRWYLSLLMKVLTSNKKNNRKQQTSETRMKKKTVLSPMMLLMPADTIRSYATLQVDKQQDALQASSMADEMRE